MKRRNSRESVEQDEGGSEEKVQGETKVTNSRRGYLSQAKVLLDIDCFSLHCSTSVII